VTKKIQRQPLSHCIAIRITSAEERGNQSINQSINRRNVYSASYMVL